MSKSLITLAAYCALSPLASAGIILDNFTSATGGTKGRFCFACFSCPFSAMIDSFGAARTPRTGAPPYTHPPRRPHARAPPSARLSPTRVDPAIGADAVEGEEPVPLLARTIFNTEPRNYRTHTIRVAVNDHA